MAYSIAPVPASPGVLYTTLVQIQGLAKGSPEIQALLPTDQLVIDTLNDVAQMVTQAVFLSNVERAQRCLAAHFLAMGVQGTGVRGHVSSKSAGGLSTSYTMPWLTRRDMFAATQYGMQFLNLVDRCVPPIAIAPLPDCGED